MFSFNKVSFPFKISRKDAQTLPVRGKRPEIAVLFSTVCTVQFYLNTVNNLRIENK